jgi:hypothetical protein
MLTALDTHSGEIAYRPLALRVRLRVGFRFEFLIGCSRPPKFQETLKN